jgi:hypothetical protein
MSRFEQAVHDCMLPTAELLERTTVPLHRAMMVEHPVYRVTWGANPAVIEGKDAMLAFHRSVGDAVLWPSDDRFWVLGNG